MRIEDFGICVGPVGGMLAGLVAGGIDFEGALSREIAATAFSTFEMEAVGGSVSGVANSYTVSFAFQLHTSAFFFAHIKRANSSSMLSLLGSSFEAASKSASQLHPRTRSVPVLASFTLPRCLRAIALRHNTFHYLDFNKILPLHCPAGISRLLYSHHPHPPTSPV